MTNRMKLSAALIGLCSLGTISGCANYEINTNRGAIPGYFIRSEMQEADRAVEAARQAGKDRICPAEFKAAEDAKNNAYDVFRACRTEEGAALAKEAKLKADALCPRTAPARVDPPPAPVPVPKPAPVPPPPKPVEPPPAIVPPTSRLSVTPGSITKGQPATLNWTSQNTTECDIQPGIGPVNTVGSMTISPSSDTAYTLICNGAGGTTKSATSIVVVSPPPAVVAQCVPLTVAFHFETDKSTLRPQEKDDLNKIKEFLKEFPDARGVVEGHTDNVGSADYNLKLSQRRANIVNNYIIKNFGMSKDRISARGYGLTKPVADNNTAEGRQKNRRTEAVFTCNGK